MKLRNVVIVVVVAIAVLFAVALSVGAMMGGWTAYGMGHSMINGHRLPFGMHSVGGVILMVALGVLALGGLVLLLSYLVRNNKETPAGKDETPLGILDRLHESGQIDDGELERIKGSLVS